MGIAKDIINQAQTLVTERQELERTWENICRMMFLSPDRQFRRGSISGSRDQLEGWVTGSKVAERSRLIYDITGVIGLERMTAGLVSLLTPDNEKWENIKIDDPFGYKMTDEETKWADMQRDYLFTVRYDPRSGWALANQAAIASAAALGTGLYILEESYGTRNATPAQIPYTCTNLPLSDNYLTVNGQGFHDQDYRFLSMTARNAAMMFPLGLSAKTIGYANDPKQCHRMVQFIHYVGERQESGPNKNAYAAGEATPGNYNKNSRCVSCYIEVDAQSEVKHGGFSYWPVIVYNWKQMTASAYGESAAMLVMAEVASANILAKNALLSAQQQTRPAIATMDDNTMGRPNLNPAAINYGGIDKNGNLKIKPIVIAGNPQLSQYILEASRTQIDKGLYTNLWQVMMQDKNKTATQSLIEANEKGELLGPIGTRIQGGLSRCTDGELQILVDKGAWSSPNSPLLPPKSLNNRSTQSKFASPLDRLRRSGELVGIQRTLEIMLPLANTNPEVMDNFDEDEIAIVTREITGAPSRILRTKDKRDEMRKGRDQQKQLAAAGEMAKIAKDGGAALAQVAPQQQNIGELLGKFGIKAPAGAPAGQPAGP